MSKRGFVVLLRLMVVLAFILAGMPVKRAAAAGTVRYARQGGKTSGTCSSWADACELYYALNTVAAAGDQIWARQGTYTPNPASRSNSFSLKNDVAVYGGFTGTETLLGQRKPAANLTVLSGDIGVVNTSTDNSYHVVRANVVGATAKLDGFTITSGNANGGGQDNDGAGIYCTFSSPTLKGLVITGNRSLGMGGGMYGGLCNAILTKVTFALNTAGTWGGGVANVTSDSIRFSRVNFTTNYALQGAGMYNNMSSPQISNASFKNNVATTLGGGMLNFDGSSPVLNKVTFSGNSAENGGGMLNLTSSPKLTNVSFTGNHAGNSGGGMADMSDSGSVLNKVNFRLNDAVYGGALFTDISSPVLKDVNFTGNEGSNGGAIHAADSLIQVRNSTFSGNQAELGGAINATSTLIWMDNDTLTGNHAFTGGAIRLLAASTATLVNVTVSGNTATNSAGFEITNSTITISDSILWNNLPLFGVTGATINVNDSIVQSGCPGAAGFTCTHVVNQNPLLDALKTNGGFTKTMALLPGSPAIDTGKNATCAPKDQRGVNRPQGIRCDMGAYEWVP